MDGMQHFDGEIERLVRAGVISGAVGLQYATNAGNLRVMMADVNLNDAGAQEDSGIEHGLISQ